MRSIARPSSGASTNSTMISASGHGTPHPAETCQYVNAMNMPMAPWAKLKMPDVWYVTTSPQAVSA